MNYTPKYHLPQWDAEDRIMRTDFNQMCADMESGLSKTASDAAAAIASAAGNAANDTASAATAAAAAQATADQAVAAAAAAQAAADAAYSPSQKPYVVGTYTGTGTERSISVGFQPSFLILCSPTDGTPYEYFFASGMGINRPNYLEFTSNGFKLFPLQVNQSLVVPPLLNHKDCKYVYIAFR